jgi:hypothetical protein
VAGWLAGLAGDMQTVALIALSRRTIATAMVSEAAVMRRMRMIMMVMVIER